MVAAFRPVKSQVVAETIQEDPAAPASPSTSRPHPRSTALSHATMASHKDPATPAAALSLAGTDNTSRPGPLPLSSPPPHEAQRGGPDGLPNDTSRHSASSSKSESMDVDKEGSDAEDAAHADNLAASDEESVNADDAKSSKKRKSQRFYCTDYPPCSLSFTRSEHLARHIRKHTGERPFQCHCSRRFSRLDNLRQHAQTVHVNENIPLDSLAATGSRFQRQVRTDRVRQAGNRARAATSGSAGGPSRSAHSKSLSTSSIATVGSVGSPYPLNVDPRRRPPPLVMATDPRARLSIESYRANPDGSYSSSSFQPQSPADYGTPTSATYSTAQSSPRWPPALASPSVGHARSHSMYTPGHRTPGRRLSVPSAAGPGARGALYGPAGGVVANVHPAPYSPRDNPSISPTGPASSPWAHRRDSTASAADEAWRRRTWHPDSRDNNAVQLPPVGQRAAGPNPVAPMPTSGSQPASSTFRLPGIESFDPFPHRRPPSPMKVETADRQYHQQAPYYTPPPPEAMPPEDRRKLSMHDAGLHRGFNRLDLSSYRTPPRDHPAFWASEAAAAAAAAQHAQHAPSHQHQPHQPHPQHPPAEPVRPVPLTVRFEDQLSPSQQRHENHAYETSRLPPPPSAPSHHQQHHPHHRQTFSVLEARPFEEAPPRSIYHPHAQATSHAGGPADAPGTHDPRPAQVDRMIHPNLNDFRSFPARDEPDGQRLQQEQQQQQQAHQQAQQQAYHHAGSQMQHLPQQQQQQHPQIYQQHPLPPHPQNHHHLQQHHHQQDRPPKDDSLGRLEALVAVATGQGSVTTAY